MNFIYVYIFMYFYIYPFSNVMPLYLYLSLSNTHFLWDKNSLLFIVLKKFWHITNNVWNSFWSVDLLICLQYTHQIQKYTVLSLSTRETLCRVSARNPILSHFLLVSHWNGFNRDQTFSQFLMWHVKTTEMCSPARWRWMDNSRPPVTY